MSYDAIVEARKEAEARMTPERLAGIRLGLQMAREHTAAKAGSELTEPDPGEHQEVLDAIAACDTGESE